MPGTREGNEPKKTKRRMTFPGSARPINGKGKTGRAKKSSKKKRTRLEKDGNMGYIN